MKIIRLIAPVLLVAGCGYVDVPSEVVNGVAVATQPSQTANFTSYTTFYVDPKVGSIGGVADGGSPTYVPDGVASAITSAIAANMIAAGYTQVTTAPTLANHADLAIQASALTIDNTYYYPGYWCGYYPYYYYYGCYYSWSYYGTYTTGTLLVEMLDLNNLVNGKATTIWGALAYGVVAGTGYGNPTAVTEAINRAFSQSPYIKK